MTGWAAVVGALALASASSAAADIMTVTIGGTVDRSYDANGYFGPRSGRYDGQDFTIKFTFDSSVESYYDPYYPTVHIFGGFSPVAMTLNGHEFDYDPAAIHGLNYVLAADLIGVYLQDVADPYFYNLILLTMRDIPLPPTLTATSPFHWTGSCACGYYQFAVPYMVQYASITQGNFNITRFDVTGPGVPEPASWGLLIAGFGLAGAALRRQRGLTMAA